MFATNRAPSSTLYILKKCRNLSVLKIRCYHITAKSKAKSAGNFEVCHITDSMVDPCKPEPAVVVIGAGIAGLSAAQRLCQSGINNFTVLEATDRPGGRIHSCWLGDVIAEMGAHYIEGGCSANPVYNLAAQEGLLAQPLSRIDPSKGLYCTSDGRAIDAPVAVTAYHVFRQIQNEAGLLFSMGSGKHGSLMNFFNLRIQQELQNFPEEQRYDASRILYGLTGDIRARWGEDLSKLSAENYGSYINIPGGSLRVPLGFVGVLAPLLRELPDCSLKYCKPVGNIRWGAVQARNKGPRAVVQCCDGDEYCADYVIVTVSLGVLKQHADKLFCPALPAEKTEAIKALGPFWVWHEGGIKFAWSADELSARCNWTKGLSHIEEVEGSKHVLCAYVSGPEAATMEKATDEEVAEGITKVLRQFTGDASLPYPSTILRSKWITDPYFCGSFSYMGLNSTIGHQCDLASPLPGPCEPEPPILLFAGEATCAGHYSTVHGARLSGIREAERIIQLTKKLGGPPPKH
ncbi:Flavin containing amine oxidoreductase [Popillia japonica]|uniref:Flavin containing amine oxidoreductase n=1 Tax=Popillia japonica TaxID=7064 RepID=A0AAW1K4I0_POPJA